MLQETKDGSNYVIVVDYVQMLYLGPNCTVIDMLRFNPSQSNTCTMNYGNICDIMYKCYKLQKSVRSVIVNNRVV